MTLIGVAVACMSVNTLAYGSSSLTAQPSALRLADLSDTTPEATTDTLSTQARHPYGNGESARFVANKEPAEQLFKALGSEIHKTVRLSAKARPYRISGNFDLSQPFDVLERVTGSLGLIWYYDGQVIYVYDSSETASVMLSAPPGAADDLIAFLKNASLYDKRFPLRYASGSSLIYLSAPPKYVEIVQNAAAMLRKEERVIQHGERRVEVVKLRHAFVTDRTIAMRDTQATVPGLARVLMDVMGSNTELKVDDADVDQPMPATQNPSMTSAFALPPGVREMPPLDIMSTPASGSLRDPATSTDRGGRGASKSLGNRSDASAPIRIVAYPSNNSLLLEGTSSQIAQARRIVALLDIPKDQVELSLWVIDVEKKDMDALGASWGASGKLGPLGVSFNASALGQGATLSRGETLQFVASIVALSEKNKARIVSRPILLAQDNSPAVFDNSKSFFVKVRGERVASLQKVTYGTMINVLPHVVDTNGRIEMELAIEDGNRSANDPQTGLSLPTVSSTNISTVARVLHEQSLLVGGYTLNENSEGVNKIPLLGDIPLIGQLFTYRATKGSQSVRLFLIQPRLLAEDDPFDTGRIATPSTIDDTVDALRLQLEHSRG